VFVFTFQSPVTSHNLLAISKVVSKDFLPIFATHSGLFLFFLFLKTTDVLILGGGPAGLFTAINCKNRRAVILEKNATPGKKLLISGTGRCNLTHDCKLSDFFEHYGANHRFLKTALHSFTNTDLISFFNSHGLETVVDKNGKVFPASQKASDVLQVLIDACITNKVEIAFNQKIEGIKKNATGFEVKTGSGVYAGRFLVITTGGMSYPATGSTGDGYHFAKQLGHSVVPPKPSLSPVFVRDYAMASISGVSVQNKAAYLYRGDKKIAEHRGDIGFTHKGLSGPGILDFSRHILSGDFLKLNFIDMRTDDFRNELITAAATDGKVAIQTYLKKFDLPRNLVLLILNSINMEPETRVADITKTMRNQLVTSFCEFPFTIEKVGGFNMAMVTAGGISLDEIYAKTMESKLVPGLFFAGEVLDIDGDTGGYNLQAAFSTGYLAGQGISG
jgi:predicted Rossmann fold flavoprotein